MRGFKTGAVVLGLPCFLFAGRHLQEDVPQLLASASASLPDLRYRIGDALGPGPELIDLLLLRAGLAAP